MASAPKRNTAATPAANPALAAAGEEHEARLVDARQQKRQSQTDIEECYFFAAPRRARSATSNGSTANRQNDASELQTGLGFECAEDFMTMIIDSFMPQAGRWAERLADPGLRQGLKDQIEKVAREEDDKVFQWIRASNFHAELAKQGIPDGSIGVFAMHIHQPRLGNPPLCVGVPIRELEMDLGPDGKIDTRFVCKPTRYRHVKALLPGVDLPPAVLDLIKKKPNDKVTIEWGYWRLWEKDDDEYWRQSVRVGDTMVQAGEMKGQGCCPLVIGRFGATPDYAWPDGPMIKALPDLRQEDETAAAFVENLDFSLRPPKAYDDDGVIGGHLEDGIEPGMLYPRRPGSNSRNTFESIYEPTNLQPATFERLETRRRVRRLHYVDFPEQQGKTPPTLGQWLDEMVDAQKKIGTPGYAFWREFPYEVFCRFTYLAEKAGKTKPVEIEGAGKVSLQAYNPAQRAQENQEVLTATRLMQIGATGFPQTWQVAVDELVTLNNLQTKLGDKLVKFRTKDDLAGATDMLSKLGGVFGPKLGGGLNGPTQ